MALTAEELQVKIHNTMIIEKLNFSLKPGEVWGILGCNGSGKTTLLHTLAGLYKPHLGQVLLNAKPLDEITRKIRAQHIALLLQQQQDIFPHTVWDTLSFSRHPYSQTWGKTLTIDGKIIERYLNLLDLTHLKYRRVDSLSGGERRRVAIAAVLSQDAPYLLLDEPTQYLDVRYQIQILQLMRKLAEEEEKGIIMALHDINQAYHFCDFIIMLFQPDDILVGASKTNVTVTNLQRLYHHPIQQMGKYFIPISNALEM